MKQASKAFSLGLVALVCFFFANCFAYADDIYVANRGNNTITKYDSSGNGSVFARLGLDFPEGLAFDSSGNLFVANAGDNTIMKYDSSGHRSLFASSGLDDPYGLAFDNSGNLYVANNRFANPTIMKFDSSGNGTVFTNTLPAPTNPTALTFDPSGNLFVAYLSLHGIGLENTEWRRKPKCRLPCPIRTARLNPSPPVVVGGSLNRSWIT